MPPSYLLRRRAAPVAGAMALLLAVACGDASPRPASADTTAAAAPVRATDDAGREVRLDAPARRVVSLVPSVNDVIVALGGTGQLVGRTRYDTRPELAHLPSVGGGLDPSLETLLALRPDLVVTWDHDDRSDTRRRLEQAGARTFAVQSDDTTRVYTTIERMGVLLGRAATADSIVAAVRAEMADVRRSVAGRPVRTAFYVVGAAPPMTAGPGTFIGQLMTLAGGRSVFDDVDQPWPTVAIEELVRRQPEVIVLPVGADSATAVRTLDERPGWRELRAVRERRVRVVPADLMNRYGADMGRAARAMRDALHPELASPGR